MRSWEHDVWPRRDCMVRMRALRGGGWAHCAVFGYPNPMLEPVIDLRETAAEIVVSVDGDVDGGSAEALDEALERAVAERNGARRQVVVDLSGLRFIDSSGMSCLVRAANRLRPDGASLVVRGTRPNVRRLFTIAGLQQVVEFV